MIPSDMKIESCSNFSDGITLKNSIISKQVERKKIDEMKLPEKLTYTLPSSDASSMKIFAKLLSGSFETRTLLETEQLKVNLSFVSTCDASSFNCTSYTCWLKGSKRHLVIIFFIH